VAFKNNATLKVGVHRVYLRPRKSGDLNLGMPEGISSDSEWGLSTFSIKSSER